MMQKQSVMDVLIFCSYINWQIQQNLRSVLNRNNTFVSNKRTDFSKACHKNRRDIAYNRERPLQMFCAKPFSFSPFYSTLTHHLGTFVQSIQTNWVTCLTFKITGRDLKTRKFFSTDMWYYIVFETLTQLPERETSCYQCHNNYDLWIIKHWYLSTWKISWIAHTFMNTHKNTGSTFHIEFEVLTAAKQNYDKNTNCN